MPFRTIFNAGKKESHKNNFNMNAILCLNIDNFVLLINLTTEFRSYLTFIGKARQLLFSLSALHENYDVNKSIVRAIF